MHVKISNEYLIEFKIKVFTHSHGITRYLTFAHFIFFTDFLTERRYLGQLITYKNSSIFHTINGFIT